ncbi:ABC-2 type transport system ATP-binding protein [Pullulanibacillus pueri]|uniref:Putative ABC transporter ATP-binding protein YhcH n=1 Tax=Pullulanibacillus pueri TaxID=1437324 RepID=A0A8J2ZRM4_9BACL|nr:ABC transporter ATP-binding protein [Pullulanibacillus pueri]MBM7680028.1 ABC-2 type transport system ATP-binding protein [Pullulanibacillus pueri]GGH74010.1 putative ABC transporter ATP-binding protein YhcH [Pullulanibacillus pueri]
MTQPAIQLQHVKKKIGSKTIIKDLSFDIYPGEVFGFLGPNGAGKTTTIRMIVGLMKMSEGDILIFGKSIKKHYKEAIKPVGAIVENPELYKHLSGYLNLIHYARMVNGVTKKRIDEVVELVGLKQRIHEKVKTYSLGMRQRLGLAQALLHSPKILILDEPTNGLDPAGIREIRQYIRRLAAEEGLAVIVSSHLLSEMELMCDRLGIIQNGQLVGVHTVGEFVGNDHEVMVRFAVDPIDRAFAILSEHYQASPQKEGNQLLHPMNHEDIPELIETLVQNNIKIYGVHAESKTLEEKFLEVTGGEKIV